jgi:hypothetical protein
VLVRPPRGFPADFEFIDDLKHRNFVFWRAIDDAAMTGPRLRQTLVKTWPRWRRSPITCARRWTWNSDRLLFGDAPMRTATAWDRARNRSMKKWIALALVLASLLALGAYVAAGPFLAMNGIRTALAEQDAAKLSRHIDFPALRVSLKAQVEDAMARRPGERNPVQAARRLRREPGRQRDGGRHRCDGHSARASVR